MNKMFRVLFILWPGSTGVFRYGLWGHLAVALVFGFIFQAYIFLNFYWSQLLSTFWRVVLGAGLFVIWGLFSAAASSNLKKYEKMRDFDSTGEAFLEAQTHYLRGNWFETECCLKNLLRKNPYDAEALLLLATMFRHLNRYNEARKTLSELEKTDSASYWRYEIALEKQAITDDENSADDDVDENDEETTVQTSAKEASDENVAQDAKVDESRRFDDTRSNVLA